MKRRQGWLFFIIFLLTLSFYLLINYPLQLGLDLQGGSQLTLQIIKDEGKVTRDELEAVNSVIDKRVNNLWGNIEKSQPSGNKKQFPLRNKNQWRRCKGENNSPQKFQNSIHY